MESKKEETLGAEVRPRKRRAGLSHSPTQRLMIVDMAQKSGLPLTEFAAIVGVPYDTLHVWKRRLEVDPILWTGWRPE